MSIGRSSDVLRASQLVREIGGSESSCKGQIWRAHQRLPALSYNRVRDLYFAVDRVRVWSDELTYLEDVASKYTAESELHAEISSLRKRLSALEQRLGSESSPEGRALRHVVRLGPHISR